MVSNNKNKSVTLNFRAKGPNVLIQVPFDLFSFIYDEQHYDSVPYMRTFSSDIKTIFH